jgi:hypothetical protein
MSFFAVDPIEDPIRASLKKVERIECDAPFFAVSRFGSGN